MSEPELTFRRCADCGDPYPWTPTDRIPWCLLCAVRRDQWAAAQEIRTIATAVLKSDVAKIRDVA